MTARLTVPTTPGFNFRSVVNSHGWAQLAPFRYDSAMPDTLRYTLPLAHDRAVSLTLNATPDHIAVATDAALSDAKQAVVMMAIRQIFGLDIDLSDFYERIANEPRYGWVQQQGAGRLLAAPTAWEDLVKTLFTTNVSWTNTVNMVARLVRYGTPATDGTFAFPTPAQVLAHEPNILNAEVRCGYRINSLYQLANAIESKAVNVEDWRDSTLDGESLYQQITALHGFGAYAAGSVLRLWGHYNYLGLDSVARAAFAEQFRAGVPAPDKDIAAHYAPYGSWQGLALWIDIIAPDSTSYL